MSGANRPRRRARREVPRDPRPIVLIVCEGAKTEKQYFEKFALHHENSLIRVRVADETGVPFSLVKCAKRYKRDFDDEARRQRDVNLAIDSVWCVYDVDDHPHLSDAKIMAADNGIRLAISNPCFELWLVLHLREGPGVMGRHDLQGLLKEHIPNYAKHIDFAQYAPGYTEAVKRAKRLDQVARQAGTPGHNPTTNVYELTELILRGKASEPSSPNSNETT